MQGEVGQEYPIPLINLKESPVLLACLYYLPVLRLFETFAQSSGLKQVK